jgi:hypothetical protein
VVKLFIAFLFKSVFFIACRAGRLSIVKELLKNNANIEADDNSGCTALMHGD